jgi:hypothetical protein
MRRKGFSLSMNYAVVGLIALTVAFLAVTIFTGNAQGVGAIISGSIDQSTKNFAEEQCVIEKRRLCDLEKYVDGSCGPPGTNADNEGCWAGAATVQGRTCDDWIDKNSILGGQIKQCSQDYEEGLSSDSGGGGGTNPQPPNPNEGGQY